MLRILTIVFVLISFMACTESPKGPNFGEKITTENAIKIDEAVQRMQNAEALADIHLSEGITVQGVIGKFEGEVDAVCQSAGCWFSLKLENGESIFIDTHHEFLVAKDLIGKQVVVKGDLYTVEHSVEEQQAEARDAGMADAEVAQITEPTYSYTVSAKGVVIKE